MSWQRYYVLGGNPFFENKERKEAITAIYRKRWDVDVNHKRVDSSPTEAGAKEIVIKYMREHP